jgi:CHAD domain-containing protein
MLAETGLQWSNREIPDESVIKQFHGSRYELAGLARQAGNNPVDSTHQIRKKLKYFRAFAKLFRNVRCEDSYKAVNRFLRDQGREFSGLRDAHVRRILISSFRNHDLFESFDRLFSQLHTENELAIERFEKALLSGVNRFDLFAVRIESSPVLEQYFSREIYDAFQVTESYLACYRASRTAFYSGFNLHDAETLHEWRKRLKDLHNQSELLAGSDAAETFPFCQDLEQLCDRLGEINDFFMLTEWIESVKSRIKTGEDIPALMSELKQQKDRALRCAEREGNQFYAANDSFFATLASNQPKP